MTSATPSPINDPTREMLRHIVATLAYRAGKTLRGAPESFAAFKASAHTRTPVEILAHMGDLADWALSTVQGKHEWHTSDPLPWPQEVSRFFAALEALDAYLASGHPLLADPRKLFQAGLADALTHTGQIGMLRGIAGCPVRGENYFAAEIELGRVGINQVPSQYEF